MKIFRDLMQCGSGSWQIGERVLRGLLTVFIFLVFFTTLLIETIACANGTPDLPSMISGKSDIKSEDKATIDGYNLHLKGQWLLYKGIGKREGDIGEFSIDISGACRFHRDINEDIRTLNTKSEIVVLIVCSHVLRSFGMRQICNTKIRGVVITRKGINLSEKIQSVRACPPALWDEKMFLYFIE